MRWSWISQVALSTITSVTSVFIRTHSRDTQREVNVMTEAETGMDATTIQGMNANQGLPQSPESRRKDGRNDCLEPTESMWPCEHLDIRLLTSEL